MPILLGLVWCIILIFMWPSALGNMGYVPVKILSKNKNIQEFQHLSFTIINMINCRYDFLFYIFNPS